METYSIQRNCWKFLLIVVASTVFAVLLHQVHYDPLMNLKTKPQSIVITSGWFPPVAFVSLALSFCIMGLIFLWVQKTLQGTGLRKGVLFGLALSGLWIMGMIEAYVIFKVSLLGEIYTGIADSCGILVMSVLLGKYLAKDNTGQEKQKSVKFAAILIILVMYLIVRYCAYVVLYIDSAYSTRPLATLLWTVGMGGWVGIMYRLVGGEIGPHHPLKDAVMFGGLVFGLNWLLYNLFALLFIVVPVSDLISRSGFDTFGVILGVYLSSMLSENGLWSGKGIKG